MFEKSMKGIIRHSERNEVENPNFPLNCEMLQYADAPLGMTFYTSQTFSKVQLLAYNDLNPD